VLYGGRLRRRSQDTATHNAGDALGAKADGDAIDTHINPLDEPGEQARPHAKSVLWRQLAGLISSSVEEQWVECQRRMRGKAPLNRLWKLRQSVVRVNLALFKTVS
jgi:hypothetical protein